MHSPYRTHFFKLFYPDDELPLVPAGSQRPHGLGRLLHRVRGLPNRVEVARVNHLADVVERGGVGANVGEGGGAGEQVAGQRLQNELYDAETGELKV